MRERGQSTLILALSITVLLAAVGLSADFGNLTVQQARLQKGVDNAALALAQDCALGKPSCSTSSSTTGLVADNADADTVAVTQLDTTGKKVTVEADAGIRMALGSLIGIDDKPLEVSATASWGSGHPTEGYPVLPIGVAECTFRGHEPIGGSGSAADAFLIRMDVLQTVTDLVDQTVDALTSLTQFLEAVLVPTQDLVDAVTGSEAECGAGELLSLQGGAWLSEAIDLSLTEATCEVNTEVGTLVFASATVQDVLMSKCITRLGSTIKKGDTILLPIYRPAPALGLVGELGLSLSACGTEVPGGCLRVPPSLSATVVGYAPFTVTGWVFGSNNQPDTSLPVCQSIAIDLPLFDIVKTLVKPLSQLPLVGGLLTAILGGVDAVVGFLLGILGFQVVHASVGCNGIQGYFTKTFTTDPTFQYGSDGADFGASRISLIE